MTMHDTDWKELIRLRHRLGGKSADDVQRLLEAEDRALDARRDARRRETAAALERSVAGRPSARAWTVGAFVLAGALGLGLATDAGVGLGAPLCVVGSGLLAVGAAYRQWAAQRSAQPLSPVAPCP